MQTYRIHSNTHPKHLVATVWGLDAAERLVSRLNSKHPEVAFLITLFVPSDMDGLVVWEDASFCLN